MIPEFSRPIVAARVRAGGGVVRSVRLTEAGVPRSEVAAAVAEGELARIRRVWVAVPDADPMLVAAARDGVVLSCVTGAARLGAWEPERAGFHVAAHPHSGRIAVEKARVHRAIPVVPRHPDALVDPVENALDLVARCQPREVALTIVESCLRHDLVDRALLERLPICASLREILQEALPFADSGLETILRHRLRWMGLRLLAQASIAGRPVDLLIGERLVLQIDGAHHVGRQREADIRHDARLKLLGYHVIRVGYFQIMNDWASVQDLIMRAVAQGLHLES